MLQIKFVLGTSISIFQFISCTCFALHLRLGVSLGRNRTKRFYFGSSQEKRNPSIGPDQFTKQLHQSMKFGAQLCDQLKMDLCVFVPPHKFHLSKFTFFYMTKMYSNPTHPSNLNSIISKKSSLKHPDHLLLLPLYLTQTSTLQLPHCVVTTYLRKCGPCKYWIFILYFQNLAKSLEHEKC